MREACEGLGSLGSTPGEEVPGPEAELEHLGRNSEGVKGAFVPRGIRVNPAAGLIATRTTEVLHEGNPLSPPTRFPEMRRGLIAPPAPRGVGLSASSASDLGERGIPVLESKARARVARAFVLWANRPAGKGQYVQAL